jgi:hypothetical protein
LLGRDGVFADLRLDAEAARGSGAGSLAILLRAEGVDLDDLGAGFIGSSQAVAVGLGDDARGEGELDERLSGRLAPPLRVTSRDTVDGERSSRLAMPRSDSPEDRPREISSRSAKVRQRTLRVCSGGGIPPLERRKPKTDPGGFPSTLLIALNDSPAFHRSHMSARSRAGIPRLPTAMPHRALLPGWRHGVASTR